MNRSLRHLLSVSLPVALVCLFAVASARVTAPTTRNLNKDYNRGTDGAPCETPNAAYVPPGVTITIGNSVAVTWTNERNAEHQAKLVRAEQETELEEMVMGDSRLLFYGTWPREITTVNIPIAKGTKPGYLVLQYGISTYRNCIDILALMPVPEGATDAITDLKGNYLTEAQRKWLYRTVDGNGLYSIFFGNLTCSAGYDADEENGRCVARPGTEPVAVRAQLVFEVPSRIALDKPEHTVTFKEAFTTFFAAVVADVLGVAQSRIAVVSVDVVTPDGAADSTVTVVFDLLPAENSPAQLLFDQLTLQYHTPTSRLRNTYGVPSMPQRIIGLNFGVSLQTTSPLNPQFIPYSMSPGAPVTDDGGSDAGLVVGAVIGVVLGLCVIGGAFCFFRRKFSGASSSRAKAYAASSSSSSKPAVSMTASSANTSTAPAKASQAPPLPPRKQPAQPSLPPDWEEHTTENGDVYYWNSRTGESTWERPTA